MNFPTPRIIQEREQPFLSRKAKVTDAGEGLTPFKIASGCLGCSLAMTLGLSTYFMTEIIYPRNDVGLVGSPDNPNTFNPAVTQSPIFIYFIQLSNVSYCWVSPNLQFYYHSHQQLLLITWSPGHLITAKHTFTIHYQTTIYVIINYQKRIHTNE